jgi:hypothetical protein
LTGALAGGDYSTSALIASPFDQSFRIFHHRMNTTKKTYSSVPIKLVD